MIRGFTEQRQPEMGCPGPETFTLTPRYPHGGDTHILQVAVAHLRKKIGEDAGNPKYIITRPGIGYMFKKP